MKTFIPSQKYYNSIGIPDDVLQKFLDSLILHVSYVQEAGKTLGVSQKQLNRHDSSKWSKAEFGAYAKHFHGGGAPNLFVRAWNHHLHKNPHHHEYWRFSNGFSLRNSDVENGVLPMPNRFALEMIADWQGASKAYTGDWDMTDWLTKNAPKIELHSTTAKFVNLQLARLGYNWYDFKVGV